MAKAFRATETGPFSASQAAISVKKANNETFFIKNVPLHKCIFQPPPQKNKNQTQRPTLLVFGQLHGGVDVGGHLVGAEAAVLLAAAVGVVAL